MLTIKSLNAGYGKKAVLQDINMEIHPGEVLALIGPNGAGKSTLIRTISGVLPKTSGSVTFNQLELTDLSPRQRARQMAVVPQARQLGGAYTVEQMVMMGRTAHMGFLGHPSEEDIAHVAEALENTHSQHLAQRKIAELSGGEQQLVLLARALAQSAPVLLLDEPTNHLDLKHQSLLLSLVRDLAQKEQLAVLMALHDLNQVSLYANRIALLVDGRLTATGTPQQVLTAETISQAYNTTVQAITNPDGGEPIILPK